MFRVDHAGEVETQGLTIGGGSKITGYLEGVVNYDPPSLASGSITAAAVNVPGAMPGDVCFATHDQMGSNNFIVSAFVQSAGVVRVIFYNVSGNTIDLPGGTLRAGVVKH